MENFVKFSTEELKIMAMLCEFAVFEERVECKGQVIDFYDWWPEYQTKSGFLAPTVEKIDDLRERIEREIMARRHSETTAIALTYPIQ